MEPKVLALIVAVAENRVIGRGDQLPWHLSRDLRRFKRLTMGHAILMGRRTWESLRRPLPGRQNIVISRHPDVAAPGCRVVPDLSAALRAASDDPEVFVIGGRQIYELALPHVQRLYWTQVHAQVAGDTLFPPVHWQSWQLLTEEGHPADAQNDYPCTFRVYQRTEY